MAITINKLSGMPQMKAAFAGWQTKITLTQITEQVVQGLVEITESQKTFIGTIQPLSAKAIALKPEGQRAFTWLQIHCTAGSLNLNVNDRIIYNDKKYKIMALLDYSLNNYIEYHACEDYQE